VPDRSRGKADRALGDGAQEDLGSTRRRFAAGYAACFGGSLDFVAKQKKRDASQAKVTCAVTIGGREAGGFGISVKMRVEERALDRPSSPRSCGKHTRKSAPTRMRRVATWRSCSMWSAVEDAAAAFEPAGMHAAHKVNGHASRTPSRSPSSSWRCCRPDSVA
jgi:hypothetical protein